MERQNRTERVERVEKEAKWRIRNECMMFSADFSGTVPWLFNDFIISYGICAIIHSWMQCSCSAGCSAPDDVPSCFRPRPLIINRSKIWFHQQLSHERWAAFNVHTHAIVTPKTIIFRWWCYLKAMENSWDSFSGLFLKCLFACAHIRWERSRKKEFRKHCSPWRRWLLLTICNRDLSNNN